MNGINARRALFNGLIAGVLAVVVTQVVRVLGYQLGEATRLLIIAVAGLVVSLALPLFRSPFTTGGEPGSAA